jgi:hypothetical protein
VELQEQAVRLDRAVFREDKIYSSTNLLQKRLRHLGSLVN